MLLDCCNKIQFDIDSNYDKSDYNQAVLKKTQEAIKVGIMRIEEGQDCKNKILNEGAYKTK